MSEPIVLTPPLTDEDVAGLRAGDRVLITGSILTGRDAHPELVKRAAMVTEMKEIKHPFQSGVKARKGIEF